VSVRDFLQRRFELAYRAYVRREVHKAQILCRHLLLSKINKCMGTGFENISFNRLRPPMDRQERLPDVGRYPNINLIDNSLVESQLLQPRRCSRVNLELGEHKNPMLARRLPGGFHHSAYLSCSVSG
jgi:hypothetical protein